MKNSEDLAKVGAGLAGHFTKAAAHHDGLHKAHDALHKAHAEHAAFVKGTHDAMDDGHEMKGYMAKAHEHHTAKAAHHKALSDMHKAHAEHLASLAKDFSDSGAHEMPAGKTEQPVLTKTEPAAPPVTPAEPVAAAPTGIDAMVKETTAGLVKKSLEMLNSDTAIQDEIRKMVLEGVRSALGNKLVPTEVHSVLPDIPQRSRPGNTDGLQLVPRAGGPEIDTKDVPHELRQLVEA